MAYTYILQQGGHKVLNHDIGLTFSVIYAILILALKTLSDTKKRKEGRNIMGKMVAVMFSVVIILGSVMFWKVDVDTQIITLQQQVAALRADVQALKAVKPSTSVSDSDFTGLQRIVLDTRQLVQNDRDSAKMSDSEIYRRINDLAKSREQSYWATRGKLGAASQLLKAGQVEAARQLTLEGVAELVGSSNTSCRSTPFAKVDVWEIPDELMVFLQDGSPYVSLGTEKDPKNQWDEYLKIRVDGYVNAC